MQKRKSCEGCPAYYDPCLWSGSGDNPAHLIVIAENPSGFSIGASKAFSGYNGRMFRRLLNMTRGAAPANGQLKIYYTYAVLAGQIDPTAEHLRRCQANLQRELQLVTGADGREPLILTLGVNAMKALGISVKKLTDVIGRPISYVIQSPKGPRQLRVIPMFAMGALDKNPGWTQVAIAGLHQATTLALAGVATESRAEKIGKLTENYVYPKTIEEVRALISHIIGYYDRSGHVGPDGWMVALDTETNCLEPSSRSDPKVLMLSVAWDIGKAATILLDHPETPYPAADAWAEVRRLLESPKPKVFHNLKFDQKFIERVYGIRVHNAVWDTMCGEHFLDEDKKGMYGLKKLVTFYAPAYTGYDDDLQKILRGRDSAVASFSMKDILQSNGTPPAGMDAYLWNKLYQAVFGWDVEMKLPKEQRSQELLGNKRTEIDQLFKQLDIKKKRPKKKSKKGEEADTGGAKGFEGVPLDTILSYAGIDADATRIIARTQLHRLGTTNTRDDGMGVMHKLYVPASRALGQMEHNGFRVDREYLDQVEDGVTNMLVAAERELRGKFDSAVNYSSPAQVVKLMSRMNFENIKGATLGVTDKATLDVYIRHYQPTDPRHEFASRLLEFRAAHKAKTGFLRKIRKLSAADGRIHCSFNLTGTATGRLSATRPNMQNIPKYMCRIVRTDSAGKKQTIHPGYNIKKLFIPSSDEYRILNIDIKGAELRVYTAYSRDQNMIDALLRGLDVHSYVTSKITGIPYDVIEREKETNPEIKALRTRSKRVVFGIFYGAGAFKIAEQLGCTKEEAQVVIDQIFAEFPALHSYVEDTKNEVRRKQFVRTHFGRYRRFKLASVNDKHFSAACREAVNFLIQSTASDLVLGQLCEISDNVQDIQGRMLITVHDSIAMEIPADVMSLETVGDDNKKRLVDRKGQVHAFLDKWIVQRVRDKFPWLPVPYLYDIEVGPSYGETKPIERSG